MNAKEYSREEFEELMIAMQAGINLMKDIVANVGPQMRQLYQKRVAALIRHRDAMMAEYYA